MIDVVGVAKVKTACLQSQKTRVVSVSSDLCHDCHHAQSRWIAHKKLEAEVKGIPVYFQNTSNGYSKMLLKDFHMTSVASRSDSGTDIQYKNIPCCWHGEMKVELYW